MQCQTRSPFTEIKGGDLSLSSMSRGLLVAFLHLNSNYTDSFLGWCLLSSFHPPQFAYMGLKVGSPSHFLMFCPWSCRKNHRVPRGMCLGLPFPLDWLRGAPLTAKVLAHRDEDGERFFSKCQSQEDALSTVGVSECWPKLSQSAKLVVLL